MIVAVDTGGTKTLVAVFDTEGIIVAEEKFPTPTDISEYVEHLVSTIDSLVDNQSVTCLSIALPGTIVDGVMIWAGNLKWRGVNMLNLLQTHYDCPVVVENDVNLAGLAETRILNSTPSASMYVTISTGIATGIITNGQIDPRFATTENGYIVLEHEGTFMPWEKFASGSAIYTKYGKLASEISDNQTWYEIAKNIAAGLLVLCPALRPEIVILGGGVGAHFDKFGGHLTSMMTEQLTKDYMPIYMPLIKQAVHSEEAVIYGCYYHALDVA